MTLKAKILISIAALLTAFAFGRFSTPVKTVTTTKTVEVEKKQEATDAKEHEIVIIVKKPDGTQTTTITKNEDTKTQEVTTDSKNTTTDKTVTKEGSRLTIAALGGLQTSSLSTPIYGLAISKTVFGPISVGAFGFNSGVVGISLGLNF